MMKIITVTALLLLAEITLSIAMDDSYTEHVFDEDVLRDIGDNLDEIEQILNENGDNQEVSTRQIASLDYLKESYGHYHEFQKRDVLERFHNVYARAITMSQQQTVTKVFEHSLLPGEMRGTLEIVYAGAHQQIPLFFIKSEGKKYHVHTPENDIKALAETSGIKNVSNDNLVGKVVIFQHHKRGDVMSYAGQKYPVVDIILFE